MGDATRGILADRSTPGLVRVIYPARPILDDEMAAYIADVGANMRERTESFALLVEIGEGSTLTARQRRMQADFLNEFAEAFRRYCRGQAFVVKSRVSRGILRAVLWLAPPPHPYRVFEDTEPAIGWLEAQLGRSLVRQSA